MAYNIIDLQDSHLTFVRAHPEHPGQLQSGFLTDIEPVESGMTYMVANRLIRINGLPSGEIVLANPPLILLDALNKGAEFWVANIGGSEDAFIAKKVVHP